MLVQYLLTGFVTTNNYSELEITHDQYCHIETQRVMWGLTVYPSRTPLSHSGRCQVTCSSAELVVFAALTCVGGVGTVGGAMGGE